MRFKARLFMNKGILNLMIFLFFYDYSLVLYSFDFKNILEGSYPNPFLTLRGKSNLNLT